MAKKTKQTKNDLPVNDKEKDLIIKSMMDNIGKAFGEGAVILKNEGQLAEECIPSGAPSLDEALGGGWPLGRVSEVFGGEGSGKSTLALTAVAQAQKKGMRALYIDAEHELNFQYAESLGVNMDKLMISQPSCGEEALEIARKMMSTGIIDLIVIDSIANLTPQAEIDGEVGDAHVGRQARMLSQFFRITKDLIRKTKTHIMFINQIRMKVGVMYGNPETTPGGLAVKFYSSQRVELRKGTRIESNGDIVGNLVKVHVIKNKIAQPFKRTEIDLIYGTGFDQFSDIIELGAKKGVIEKAGSWYSYNGTKLGQGKQNAGKTLADNESLFIEIYEACVGVIDVPNGNDADDGICGDGD